MSKHCNLKIHAKSFVQGQPPIPPEEAEQPKMPEMEAVQTMQPEGQKTGVYF